MRTSLRPLSFRPTAARSVDRGALAFGLLASASLALWYVMLSALPDYGPVSATAVVHLAGVVIQLLTNLFETVCLVAIARSAGIRIPIGRTLAVLLALSLLQALAIQLQALAWDAPELRSWVAALAGPGVHSPPGTGRDGASLALSHIGLLALARIGGTAEWLRSRGCARGFAWGAVFACYLASRLLTGWCADLLRGASPLG